MNGAAADFKKAKRLMSALLRMPPKHHSEMKIGKRGPKEILGKVETKRRKARAKA